MKEVFDVRAQLRDNKLLSDGWSVALLVLNGLALLFIVGWSVTHIHHTEIQVPIRFTSLTNFDALGSWYQLYELPVMGAIIFGLDFFLAMVLHRKNRLMSILVLMVSLMALILLGAITFGFTSPSYVRG